MTAARSRTSYSQRISPPDWVEMAARHEPDRRCFVRPDGSVVTYGQVRSAVRRLADSLDRLDIGPGDRVAVLATDSPEYMIAVLATMRVGAVIAPLNFRLSAPELANLLDALRPKGLFYSARYGAILPPANIPLAAGLDTDPPDTGPADGTTIHHLIGSGEDVERPTITGDDDILAVLLTSGTTGTPKGVLQSQRMIKAVVQKGIVEQSFMPDDVFYSGAPLFHVAGMGYCFYGLARRAATVLLPQFDAREVYGWLEHGAVTRCMFVPSMILSLMDLMPVRRTGFPHLRSIMYGGAPMAPSTVAEMIDAFRCDMYNGFGAGTEAGGQSMLRPADHVNALNGAPHLLGSIGTAMYGVDLKIADDSGREVPMGAVGEIWTRSDTIMSGYMDPSQGNGTVVNGWFHGGDMAWRGADGYLFLAGRRDDMIIRGGENVYPFEIESALHDHPGVAEAAVLGIADSYWGETVAAAVVPRRDWSLDEDDLRSFCRSRLAGYKVPERFVIASDFPRNSTGKTDKSRLRDLFTAQSPSGSSPG